MHNNRSYIDEVLLDFNRIIKYEISAEIGIFVSLASCLRTQKVIIY
jgi:hypothetical protein